MKDANCEICLDGNKSMKDENNRNEEMVKDGDSNHSENKAQHNVEGKPGDTGGTSGEVSAGKPSGVVVVVDVPGEPPGGTPANRWPSRASLGLEAAVTEPENKYASSFIYFKESS